MSYKDTDLSDEIQAQIASETRTNGIKIDADQMAYRVIKKHLPSFEKFEDFVSICVWSHVRRITGAELRKWRSPDDDDENQMVLSGFDRLQEYYESEVVEGDLARTVRLKRSSMNTRQRRQIENELRGKGTALIQHADQLGRETDELIAAGILDPDDA